MKLERIVALTALGLGALLASSAQNTVYAKDKPAKSAGSKGASTTDLLRAIEAERAPAPPRDEPATKPKDLVKAMEVEAALEKKRTDEKGKPAHKLSGLKERSAEKGPGVIKKPFGLPPKGMKWGISNESISQIYDKEIEAEMLPLFKKAQPGVELEALEEELKMRKGEMRRSRAEFSNTPSGLDNTPLRGEFSYNNGESLTSVTTRSGTKRHFFFFTDRLWKIYDEHALKPDGTLGATFKDAIKVLTKRFGVAPKMYPADPEKGRFYPEAEWRDTDKLIRVLDRDRTLGVVYVQRDVQEDLARYRKNRGGPGSLKPEPEMDRHVQAAMRQTAPPEDPKAKGKAKPQKK